MHSEVHSTLLLFVSVESASLVMVSTLLYP